MKPLLKPAACYVVGVVTTALAVSAGSGHWGLICFALGTLTTLVLSGYVVSRPWIASRLAAVLIRVASPREFSAKRHSASKRQERPISPKAQIHTEENPQPSTFAQVVLALRGLKCDADTARWAAGQATQRLPETAPLQEVLRLALNIATQRA